MDKKIASTDPSMNENPFYKPLVEYCKTLVGEAGRFSDFPGTVEDLAKTALKKARKEATLKTNTQRSVLATLERMAVYVAIDRMTIELIKTFQASGDFRVWENIVELNYDVLLNFCKKLIHNELTHFRGDADDVVHVTFLKAQTKIDDFKAYQSSSLQPWLQRMAKNWVLDQTRKQVNKSLYLDELASKSLDTGKREFEAVDSVHAGPITTLNQADEKERVNDALGQLTTKSEIIVRLHDGERQSMRRISEEYKMSIDRVKYRLHKARAKLKSILSQKDL